MTTTNIVIAEKYDVAYALTRDWELKTAKMKLREIHHHNGREIYIFDDNEGPISGTFVTYNHEGEIDWEFMEEIDFIFN